MVTLVLENSFSYTSGCLAKLLVFFPVIYLMYLKFRKRLYVCSGYLPNSPLARRFVVDLFSLRIRFMNWVLFFQSHFVPMLSCSGLGMVPIVHYHIIGWFRYGSHTSLR